MQRGTGADNHMLYKNKHSKETLDRMTGIAHRCKIDIKSDINDLQLW